jgi:hypothetical protein
MAKSAVIFVIKESRRHALARRISDLQIFDQLHFCASTRELRILLKSAPVDVVFCEHDEPDPPHRVLPQWADLVREGRCRLICLTGRTSRGSMRLPSGSCYVPEQIDAAALSHVVESVLQQSLDSPPPAGSRFAEYISEDQEKIYSRFYFDTFVEKELSRSRLTGRPVTLLLLEPQLSGTLLRDEQLLEPLLVRITRLLKSRIRSSDLICRYQRLRLGILLPETAPQQAAKLLERIMASLRDSFPELAIPWRTAIVAPCATRSETPHSLLQQALVLLENSPPRY